MNSMDEMLLKKASEIYSVPFEVFEGAYKLGIAEGIYQSTIK